MVHLLQPYSQTSLLLLFVLWILNFFIIISYFFLHVRPRFLSLLDQSADQIGSPALHQCVENKVKTWGVEELARKVDTTVETLTLIIDGLTQPPGFDMRQSKIHQHTHTQTHLGGVT